MTIGFDDYWREVKQETRQPVSKRFASWCYYVGYTIAEAARMWKFSSESTH
jgi:hypothetical protein